MNTIIWTCHHKELHLYERLENEYLATLRADRSDGKITCCGMTEDEYYALKGRHFKLASAKPLGFYDAYPVPKLYQVARLSNTGTIAKPGYQSRFTERDDALYWLKIKSDAFPDYRYAVSERIADKRNLQAVRQIGGGYAILRRSHTWMYFTSPELDGLMNLYADSLGVALDMDMVRRLALTGVRSQNYYLFPEESKGRVKDYNLRFDHTEHHELLTLKSAYQMTKQQTIAVCVFSGLVAIGFCSTTGKGLG